MTTETTATTSTPTLKLAPQDRMLELLSPLVEATGYELVHVEIQNHRTKILRVFIDGPEGVGIQDCVNVTRALDEPLEALTEVDKLFGGAYELEVSSPGVDRPLRKPKDFERFAGRDVRIHTLRALTAEEFGNADYQKRNPKQKNYLGVLEGYDPTHSSVKLAILATMGTTKTVAKKGAKVSKKAALEAAKKDHILIPMSLISKANIEPDFNDTDEGE